MIRKITRGTSSVNGAVTIPCTITNPNKVIVLLDVDACYNADFLTGSNTGRGIGAGSAGVYLSSVTTSQITVSGSGFRSSSIAITDYSINFSYQIIEFM